MGIFPDVEEFVHAHHACGDLTWTAPPLTPRGYPLRIACPCGIVFERWVLPRDAEEDLLLSRLSGFLN